MNIVTLTSINPSFKSQQPLCKMFTNSLLWNITALHRLKYKSCHSWFVNICPEAATRGVLWKKMLLEISQNSQENTCARASFIKKRLWHRCFPVNFAKFLRTSPVAEVVVRISLISLPIPLLIPPSGPTIYNVTFLISFLEYWVHCIYIYLQKLLET